MRQNELAVGRPPDVEFDRIGDCRSGKESGEGVVRKPTWPPSVADDDREFSQ